MSTTKGQVEVPDIGDFGDVPVIEILVSVGDQVAAEDPLLTLESDKATMDVPAPFAQHRQEISVSVGDNVSHGTAIMVIEPGDDSDNVTEAAAEAESAAAVQRGSSPTTQPSELLEADAAAGEQQDAETIQTAPPTPGEAGQAAAAANGNAPVYASPSVRRLARELGIDLRGADGSGRKGRITKQDVHAIAEGILPARRGGDGDGSAARGASTAGALAGGGGLDLLPWPSIDFERQGPVQRVPRSRIQNISARNLARNWVMIPHVTQNDEADITELEAWRKQLNEQYARENVKFTMVSFLIAASVAALKEFPNFNSSLDGDELVLKRYYNIGFAADTPNGLVVPVIKDADRKGLAQIAAELAELSAKARDGKLSPTEMSGATFTISSLGGIGGTSFTPIINAPEVAILGVTRAATKPVWNGSEFVPRLMVPLSLSYDHRVIDGASAARFCVYLTQVLADLRRVLL